MRPARPSRLRTGARRAAAAAAFLALVGLLLEAALRAAPGALIPLRALERFEPGLRRETASRLGLNATSETWILERDDGGPLLRLFRPGAELAFDLGDGAGPRRFAMDALGFCNPPGAAARRATDVLAIGDSFTACLVATPEETWPAELGRRAGLSVYNLSRGGIGPYEYVQLLRHFGVARRPRAVVMHVYEGNDLRDALETVAARAASRGEPGPPRLSDGVARFALGPLLDHPLGRHSLAFDLAVVALARGLEDLRAGVLTLAGRGPRPVDFRYALDLDGQRIAFNPENTDQSEVRHARAWRDGLVSFDAFDEPLARFAELARTHGFAPVLSYAPSAHTVYAPFVRFEDPSLAELLPAFAAAQRAHLEARARALALTWVDLTPAFQEAARERGARDLLYEGRTMHCTISGHRLTAERIAGELARLGIAPGG